MLDLATPQRWSGYDAEPDGEEIADIAQWSRDLRHRAWGAAFAGTAFTGKKGTTDLMLLMMFPTGMAAHKVHIEQVWQLQRGLSCLNYHTGHSVHDCIPSKYKTKQE